MSTDEPDAKDLAERFPHVAQLEEQLQEADIDVGDIPQRKGTTRRDLLAGSAGLLGLGGILTGATGSAQAGDDQAGQFGSQAAPLDGYVEDLYDKDGNRVAELPGDGSLDVLQELSSQSVNTEDLSIKSNPVQAALSGYFVPVGDGVGVSDAVDPSTTTTPLQDATDAVASTSRGAGAVYVPIGTHIEESTYVPKPGVSVLGITNFDPNSTTEGCFIKFPETVSPMVEFNSTSHPGGIVMDGVGFRGDGPDAPASGEQIGVKFTGGSTPRNLDFRRWSLGFFHGRAIHIESNSGPFQSNLGSQLNINEVDAGDQQAIIDIDDSLENKFGMIQAYPDQAGTGQLSDLVHVADNKQIHIGHISVGGTVDQMINTASGAYGSLWSYNYEPNHSTDISTIFNLKRQFFLGPGFVNGFNYSGADPNQYVTLFDADNVHVVRPAERNGMDYTNGVVTISSQPIGECWVYMPSSEVNNSAGTATGLVRSMATAGTGNG